MACFLATSDVATTAFIRIRFLCDPSELGAKLFGRERAAGHEFRLAVAPIS